MMSKEQRTKALRKARDSFWKAMDNLAMEEAELNDDTDDFEYIDDTYEDDVPVPCDICGRAAYLVYLDGMGNNVCDDCDDEFYGPDGHSYEL